MVTLFFLRHAQTQPILTTSPNQWGLSNKGFLQARQLKQKLLEFLESPIDMIICSEELKTYQTIYPYSKALSIFPMKWREFNEANSHFVPDTNYNMFLESKRAFFRKLTPQNQEEFTLLSSNFEEHPLVALQRFRNGISQALQLKKAKNILICTHGTVMSLFWGWQMDKLENPGEIFNFWLNLPFCGLGIWKEGNFKSSIFPEI